MDFRLRISGAVYRRALDRAGSPQALSDILTRYLSQYAEGQTAQQAGGRATWEGVSVEERSARLRHAANARWAKRVVPTESEEPL